MKLLRLPNIPNFALLIAGVILIGGVAHGQSPAKEIATETFTNDQFIESFFVND